MESDAEIRAAVQETVSYAQQKGNPKKARPLSDILQVVKEWLDAPVSTKVFKRIKGSTITNQMQGWYQAFQNVIGIKPETYRFLRYSRNWHRLDNKYDISNGPVQNSAKEIPDYRITITIHQKTQRRNELLTFLPDYFLNPNIARQNAARILRVVQYTARQKDRRKTDSIRQLLANYLAQIAGTTDYRAYSTNGQSKPGQGLGVKLSVSRTS